MKITQPWLLSRPPSFWSDLIFLLDQTAPYFGRLQWAFAPGFVARNYLATGLTEEELTRLKSVVQQIPPTASEEQICRQLMTAIFWVASDYNRTILEHSANFDPADLETHAAYPYYRVRPGQATDRPLKAEEIHSQDCQMFQHKLQVLAAPFHQQLISKYKYFQGQIFSVQNKLTKWITLLTK